MNRKFVRVGLFATLLLAGLAMAGEGKHGGHDGMRGGGLRMGLHGMPNPERMVQRLSRFLDLDETQNEELKNVALATRPQIAQLREKVRANHKALMELDVNASDYGARTQNLAVEKGQLATEITLLMSQVRADIHSLLTPEQQQKLAERIGQKHQQWQQRRRANEEDASL